MKVKFFIPDNPLIDREICNHRFGALCTFNEQTDSRYITSIYTVEMYGYKNNIRLGAFITSLQGQDNDGVSDAENAGVIRHDNYFATDKWKNPNTGIIEVIPDYYGTEFTSLGVAAFGVSLGQAKATRTPNHGQELYNISSGVFGFDFVGGVSERQINLSFLV